MIISVDHGNKSIKTPNALFTSGLIVSEGLQGFKTDYICWNNKYYTLTEQRIAYLRDKTEDERFYVLTLFAIAKELERRKVPETLDPIDITLLVGLPPAHYEQLHSRFEQYFLRRREIVDFEYNGKYYSIRVSKVLSYPQAFAAAVTQFGTLKAHSVAYIIDIGGFTIDVLKLRSGHPDLAVVESFEKGVITLYNGIASKCNALYEEHKIDEIYEYLTAHELLELPQATRNEYVLYRWNDTFANTENIRAMVERLKYQVECFNDALPYRTDQSYGDRAASQIRVIYRIT